MAGRAVIPLPNFTAVPNVLIDQVMPSITPAETKVLLYLCRATFGYQQRWTSSRFSSLTGIAARTGLHRNGVINALKALHALGVVAWRIDTRTGAKSYTLRLQDEVADQSAQPQAQEQAADTEAASTVSVPGPLVQSVDQAGTVSVPGGVHSVDPLKQTVKKVVETKERGGSSTTAADTSTRVCSGCGGPMLGLDKRYRFCSPACRAETERQRAAAAGAAEAQGRDPRVGELMRSYGEVLGYRPQPWEANAAAAKGMLAEGYPPAAVLAAYAVLKQDPYWAVRPLSLMSLRKQIGPLLAEGKVPGWGLQEGKAIEVETTTQRRRARGTSGAAANEYAAERLAALRQTVEVGA